jgi:hypothetical protein
MVKLVLEYLFYLLNYLLLICLTVFLIKIEASLAVNNSMSKGLRVKWY